MGGHHPEVAPTPKGLSEGAAAALFEQWGLFLKALGQLMAAICCFERSIEMRTRLKRWDDASTCTLHLGETLLVAGRLAAGLEAGKKAFVLADREDGPSPYLTPPIYRYGLRAHVLALRGEVGAARDDFRAALDRENRIKRGKILRLPPIPHSTLSLPRPAPSKRRLDTTGVGVPYLRFLTRLGKTREARRLAEQHKQVLLSDWGMHASYVLHCNLLLVDLLREAGDLDEAYHLLQQTSDVALARDERELLCCVALAQARRCANRMQGDLDNTETPEEMSSLREAMTSVEEGLRLASACGYSLYHIDLLTVGAWISLLQGDADSAERYARVALFGVEAPASDNSFHDATALDESAPPERRGAFPPQESGWPELLAATHPACGYVWGETAARHRLAESLLLRAARTLGRARYTPTEIDMLSAEVRSLIDTARSELAMCLTLRRRSRDPRIAETKRSIDELIGGLLTHYPIAPRSSVSRREGMEKLRIFIVHGHDESLMYQLKDYLQSTLHFPEPIILSQQPSGGLTVIEKFEEYAERIDVAFVLMTPDDLGGTVAGDQHLRSRQNVIFELGYFIGKFGRRSGRVILLHKGDLEIPSDLAGIVYIDISHGILAAGEQLRRELGSIGEKIRPAWLPIGIPAPRKKN